MSILIHLLRIFFGYVVSVVVTSIVVTASLMQTNNAYSEGFIKYGALELWLLALVMIGWLASFGAALSVTLGEWFCWRMWWYYSVCGSIIGLVLGALFQPPDFFPYLGVSFGIISGLIFWLVAGRRAGMDDLSSRKAVAIIMAVLAVSSLSITSLGLFGVLF
jgi:hypothetical protein